MSEPFNELTPDRDDCPELTGSDGYDGDGGDDGPEEDE